MVTKEFKEELKYFFTGEYAIELLQVWGEGMLIPGIPMGIIALIVIGFHEVLTWWHLLGVVIGISITCLLFPTLMFFGNIWEEIYLEVRWQLIQRRIQKNAKTAN